MTRYSCFLIAFCALSLAAGESTCADNAAAEKSAPPTAVRVQTPRGDREGFIDSRTDQEALWLRREDDGILLASAVRWDEITSAEVAGDSMQVSQLRESYQKMATERDDQLLAEPRTSTDFGQQSTQTRTTMFTPSVRVRNLEITCAGLVNLDRDVDDDGFQMTISAIGVDGLPRSVRGTLTAEFVGERRPRDSGDHLVETLDRWSIPVKAADFVDGVATYTLPFATAAPEWQFDVMPDALLTANLTAYGEGDFSATTPVLVRQFNPMRDDLQLYWGNRFAPQELSNGKPFSRFGVTQGRWPYWPR